MEQTVIEYRGVRKHRGRKMIGPIDLRIPKGYVIAIVGENGSGKSTMMNMLMQMVIPDEGEISWFGQGELKEMTTEMKQQIAFVPEQTSPEENRWTVDQAVKFRSYWYPDWDSAYYEQLMDRFGVPRDVKLRKLSKGEQRKFEIAAALAARPKLLLLDEPSSGLDPFAWKMMIDELRLFMQGGETTIVMNTHIVDEVKKLADYIVMIHQGQLMGMAEKDSLLDNWKEVWLSTEEEIADDLPGVVSWQRETSTILRVLTTECQALEHTLHEADIQMLKMRGLELDEVLSLWIQGHKPA
ncbi:ABC transporter ATP-binding protein [Paenibacillus sediminis]|uniref:ABC-2 type transport system ATP-binding protein n=1 Tax=Paenibacillus sediminis TaxID=664909 RepID=A0ABS4H7R7_9BACL|nr:ABC transporter ATP-binding protein [Paenibacillus sediminis]MBP1938563.1 ABC-2 type transport system ATP-binding protein [Paenibacillus sediminis]